MVGYYISKKHPFADKAQRHRALAPVRRSLSGWSFATEEGRLLQIERARERLPNLPPSVQADARALIAEVEAHCQPQPARRKTPKR